jgi:exonuclease SbcD
MIQFIHTADIHFGMENYGKIDPKTGIHTRLLDFERALNFCIDVAIEKNVDFFLFSGDAYKTAHPSPTQQKLLLKALLRLHKAGIPTIIVVGNHDNPLSFGKAHSLDIFGNLPLDNFYVIAKPTSLQLQTKNGPVNIVGIPWPTRNTLSINNKYVFTSATDITSYISRAVSSIIAQEAEKLDPEIPAVLAGHLTVSSGVFSGSEKRAIYGTDPLFLPSQLAIPPFDYVGLGHLHRYQDLNPGGYPAIIYSGSPERIDFGERKEDKGFCLVSIEKKGYTSHEFIKTPTRPFIQIEVTLKPDTNQTGQILDAIKQHDIREAVIKIVYHVPADNTDTVDLKKIQLACEPAMYLVGIIPVRKTHARERRIGAIKTSMDLSTLLGTYFDTKPELKSKKTVLIEKALLLAQEESDQEQEPS